MASVRVPSPKPRDVSAGLGALKSLGNCHLEIWAILITIVSEKESRSYTEGYLAYQRKTTVARL